jgi:hypothetical protein
LAHPPLIRKLGTLDCDMVETTPVVFRGRLYRFEWVRGNYWASDTGVPYYRFVDVATGEPTPGFGAGAAFGCAHVEGERVFVHGANAGGGDTIGVFWSGDLETWESAVAIHLPEWGIYNTSVCATPEGYVMAFEVGEPPEVVGVRFTNRFARSTDLLHWELLPEPCAFAKDRYTACPVIRWVNGYHYMIYLELLPGYEFAPYIVRSRDLAAWESSPHNPVLRHGPEDKQIANPGLTDEQRARVAAALDRNNSDVDLCEFGGEVVIYYSWGDQVGNEFLAEARAEGSLADFLEGWFV